MSPGDIVQIKDAGKNQQQIGIFMGYRIFDGTYECAEVMWFDKRAPNGDVVSTIQKDLIELVSEVA